MDHWRVHVPEDGGHSEKATLGGMHQDQPILQVGEPLERARAAMVLVHGRGASAEDIMTVGAELQHPGFVYVAPQAEGGAWYPDRFMEPMERNEPYLTSALEVLGSLVKGLEARIPAAKIILLGFSQGGCLTLEFAARNARRYGAVVGFSSGLIGPDDTPRDYPGSFSGTPVFLGCSDVDPHIPAARVLETGRVYERMGAKVSVNLYTGMDHTVSHDEIVAVREMVAAVAR